MIILIAAGLWAIIFARITLTESLRLEGRGARYYGLALIGFAVTALPAIGFLLSYLIPSVMSHSPSRIAINSGIAIITVLLLAHPFKEKKRGTVVSTVRT